MGFELVEKRTEHLHVRVTNHAVARLRRALFRAHGVADQFLAVALPAARQFRISEWSISHDSLPCRQYGNKADKVNIVYKIPDNNLTQQAPNAPSTSPPVD